MMTRDDGMMTRDELDLALLQLEAAWDKSGKHDRFWCGRVLQELSPSLMSLLTQALSDLVGLPDAHPHYFGLFREAASLEFERLEQERAAAQIRSRRHALLARITVKMRDDRETAA